MIRQARIAILALGVLLAPVASAHEAESHSHWWLGLGDIFSSWYAGASVTHSNLGKPFGLVGDGSITSYQTDEEPAGYRVFGALDFRYAALEVGYWDVGEASFVAQSDGTGSFYAAGPQREPQHYSGFDASLIGRVPVGDWAVFARVGTHLFETDSRFSWNTQADGPITFRQSSSGSEMLYGAGLEYRGIGNWRLIAGYTATKLESSLFGFEDDATSLSLALAYAWGSSGSP